MQHDKRQPVVLEDAEQAANQAGSCVGQIAAQVDEQRCCANVECCRAKAHALVTKQRRTDNMAILRSKLSEGGLVARLADVAHEDCRAIGGVRGDERLCRSEHCSSGVARFSRIVCLDQIAHRRVYTK